MRPTRALGSSLAIATALVALGVGAPSAFAEKTFTVSTTADLNTANSACTSPCSLRQAMDDANQSTETDNVVLVPSGTYALTEGELVINPRPNGTENIIGLASEASEVVITAEGKSPVLRVGTANDPTIISAIADLEITGGQTAEPVGGGGIYIYRNATVSLTDAAVVGNTSETRGGGIGTEGGLDVADSLIADNHVTGREPGQGGGIYNDSQNGAIVVANSTIAGNSAFLEGGGIYDLDEIKVLSATIAGNQAQGHGAGLAGDLVEIGNSILADNTVAKTKDNCSEVSDTHSLGGNLADDSSCTLAGTDDKPETNAGLVEAGGLPLLANNGGPTETIALQATSPAIDAADQLLCFGDDQRGVARPSGECDIGAFQLGKEPSGPPPGGSSTSTSTTPTTTTTSTPTVTPPGPTAPPPPVLAQTGNAATVSGTVLVRLAGTTTFVALSSLRQIPFGTVINATNGRVSVTTASPNGGTQTGEFFEGEFVLSQGHNGLVVATLTGGSFAGCPTARERSHLARVSASGKHVVRKLWADAHGSFSTKGSYAAGAVAGTEWLTEDLCDGTLIRVTRDKVAVTNLVNHHHLTVEVGHSYLAKAP
jgi:hypothetical protein